MLPGGEVRQVSSRLNGTECPGNNGTWPAICDEQHTMEIDERGEWKSMHSSS